MDNDRIDHGHPRSTAQIGGHPLHPMLIPFPIVCFIGTFLADIIYAQTGDGGWASASYWLLGIGLATAALAATAGVIDYLGDDRIRRLGDALKHMLANVAAVVIEAVNLAAGSTTVPAAFARPGHAHFFLSYRRPAVLQAGR